MYGTYLRGFWYERNADGRIVRRVRQYDDNEEELTPRIEEPTGWETDLWYALIQRELVKEDAEAERLGKWIPITPESMPTEGATVWLMERTGEVELLYLLDFEDMIDCQNGRYTHFQLPIAPEPIKKTAADPERKDA